MLLQKPQQTFLFFFILCMPAGWSLATPTAKGDLEIITLHNSDMQARVEQPGVVAISKCTQEDAAKNKCFEGFARTAKDITAKSENLNDSNELCVDCSSPGNSSIGDTDSNMIISPEFPLSDDNGHNWTGRKWKIKYKGDKIRIKIKC